MQKLAPRYWKGYLKYIILRLLIYAAPEGVGHHRSHDLRDDELDEIIISDMGRSHSGGHAYGGGGGDKNGASGQLLPNIIGHHNGTRVSNSYPSVAANKINYGPSHHGLGGEPLSRSPSAGLSGRVDWKSKYLKWSYVDAWLAGWVCDKFCRLKKT